MPHVTLLVSSANASSVSTDKSEITYRFKPSLNIPKDAKNASIQVNKSQIWFNTPNVNSTNNVLQFVVPKRQTQIFNIFLRIEDACRKEQCFRRCHE